MASPMVAPLPPPIRPPMAMNRPPSAASRTVVLSVFLIMCPSTLVAVATAGPTGTFPASLPSLRAAHAASSQHSCFTWTSERPTSYPREPATERLATTMKHTVNTTAIDHWLYKLVDAAGSDLLI